MRFVKVRPLAHKPTPHTSAERGRGGHAPQEAIFARTRRAGSQLRIAISEFFAVAAAGELADSARWLLDSRLVFLKKKIGPAPRPVRIGECWRRVVGKKLVHETRSEAQSLFLGLRQYGIAVPGGTDVLVHFRGVLEKMPCKRTRAKSLLCLRDAVKKYIPKLSAWTGWVRRAAANVYLPAFIEMPSYESAPSL